MSRPRVVLLRGHDANPWDLRPWELLADRYDVGVLVTGSNRFDLGSLALPVERTSSTPPSSACPTATARRSSRTGSGSGSS